MNNQNGRVHFLTIVLLLLNGIFLLIVLSGMKQPQAETRSQEAIQAVSAVRADQFSTVVPDEKVFESEAHDPSLEMEADGDLTI